ncbi:hypothetical protein C4D60_Mb02t11160 [Musa balbisiana]|uniref:Uncharacterized protein n=1 Tax=Musa balbisiana TaxID=52838 RepID=A0A4S8I9U8_MUSBA|nr:hypothetical protein C4D60_Mb02t11160 [Musa balbisiana]
MRYWKKRIHTLMGVMKQIEETSDPISMSLTWDANDPTDQRTRINHDSKVSYIINQSQPSHPSVAVNFSNDVNGVGENETGWKCWKHPSQPRDGVCPACLRDRLLRLCPDCANVRPCRCFPSSISSSSFSSLSSTEPARSSGRGGDGAGVGAVGPVSQLIESKPALRRSRSVAFQFLRSRSVASSVSDVAPLPRPGGGKRSALLRAFSRVPAREEPADGKLCRSRSVAAGRSQDAGSGEDGGRGKGWRWHFPNPIKAFRHRKSTTKVVQERSPLWRG